MQMAALAAGAVAVACSAAIAFYREFRVVDLSGSSTEAAGLEESEEDEGHTNSQEPDEVGEQQQQAQQQQEVEKQEGEGRHEAKEGSEDRGAAEEEEEEEEFDWEEHAAWVSAALGVGWG